MTFQPAMEYYSYSSYTNTNYGYVFRAGNTPAILSIFSFLFVTSVMILIAQFYTFCCKMKKFNRYGAEETMHNYHQIAYNQNNLPAPGL
jgi:hypothetical protein